MQCFLLKEYSCLLYLVQRRHFCRWRCQWRQMTLSREGGQAATSISSPTKDRPHASKEGSNNPTKEHIPNRCKKLVLKGNSKECLPPHYKELMASRGRSQVTITRRSNTASAPICSTEIPTWPQEQGCGLVGELRIKVQHMSLPWIDRDRIPRPLTRCTTLAPGGRSL